MTKRAKGGSSERDLPAEQKDIDAELASGRLGGWRASWGEA